MTFQRHRPTAELLDVAAAQEGALADALEPFGYASPELLLRRKLLHRVDSKFVLRGDQLVQLLAQLPRDYAVLRAGVRRIASYRTLYFDTPDLQCFHDHRRGRRPRHKIRIRHYLDRGVTSFEIKSKLQGERTRKARVLLPYRVDALPDRALELAAEQGARFDGPLEPQLWMEFRRLTLLGLEHEERVTIDVGLTMGGREPVTLDGVVIAEVKQARFSARSPIMTALRDARLRPTSASKYCTGIALTRDGVRLNRLLPALRVIERART
jgi:hypothetical protein